MTWPNEAWLGKTAHVRPLLARATANHDAPRPVSHLSTPGRPVGFLGGIIGHRIDDILELSMRGRHVGLRKAASLLVESHMDDPAP